MKFNYFLFNLNNNSFKMKSKRSEAAVENGNGAGLLGRPRDQNERPHGVDASPMQQHGNFADNDNLI